VAFDTTHLGLEFENHIEVAYDDTKNRPFESDKTGRQQGWHPDILMSTLGPLSFATIRCSHAERVAKIYQRHLHMEVKFRGQVSPELATMLDSPVLEGAPCYWLGPKAGKPWLRILEFPDNEPVVPLKRRGWMSLEISVSDVDSLATQLSESPFVSLGGPADLAIHPSIRAMQVTGVAHEVLYLTEIRETVAAFGLEPANAFVDSLFIAVLAATDRRESGRFYHALGASLPRMTQTRIGVLNRAWNQADDHEYPIAITRLAEGHLLEIDHLPQAAVMPDDGTPPAGIASLGMVADGVQSLSCRWRAPPGPVADYPWLGRLGACTTGPDGEWIEFVERTP